MCYVNHALMLCQLILYPSLDYITLTLNSFQYDQHACTYVRAYVRTCVLLTAHWTCVTRHCGWTPRQGHACLSYGGSIFIMGGFDESGYCNDMHRLKVGAGECYLDTVVLLWCCSYLDWIGSNMIRTDLIWFHFMEFDRIGLDFILFYDIAWFCIIIYFHGMIHDWK